MRILLIDNETRSLVNIHKALIEHDVHTIRFEEFDFGSTIIDKTSDLVILSGGGQYSVIENELRFAKEIEFIHTSPLPILGICLGSELIAHTFGATLERLVRKQTGPRALEILKPTDSLFADNPPLQVYESHRWAITSLPPDLIGLARSDSGFEIIRHTSLPRIGFQFHPESSVHTSGGYTLLLNALEILSKQKSP